jgi:hypothetical protein
VVSRQSEHCGRARVEGECVERRMGRVVFIEDEKWPGQLDAHTFPQKGLMNRNGLRYTRSGPCQTRSKKRQWVRKPIFYLIKYLMYILRVIIMSILIS